jgi:ribosome-associated protein
MIKITHKIWLKDSEIKISFIRAPGPGGQNVNKVASAVQLRFNVLHSLSLPEAVRSRLQLLIGKNLTRDGDFIIKASRYRTQERNKQDALERLRLLLQRAATIPKKRKKTRPTRASKERRLSEKKRHSKTKSLRTKPID